MKFLPLPILLLLASCSTAGSVPKSEKYQMEMTLHKTRADLEEAKHDLHTQKIELSILEGKMVNHEDQMASLKKDTFDLHQTRLESCLTQISHLERKLSLLESKQDEVFLQLQKMASITNEMSKALAQNKEKLNELERSLTVQTKFMTDISKLKKDVEKLSLEQSTK